ncbi:uncharacterized protein LOC134243814 [Saccostrea cucullata]|uniref:uncharacterized protein LOC134243814 n=1 Tax=Saccostrea cuccullata TaxID=36930 RepID=UPI002ED15426
MPKRKRDSTPLPRRRAKRNDGAQTSQGDSQTETSGSMGQPSFSLSNEQLQQVSEAVANILSKQSGTNPPMPIEPLETPMATREQSQGTEPVLINDNYLALTTSYDNDLGHKVSNKLKLKIVNGGYINLGLLVENSYGADPNDETRYFSMKEGSLTLAPKSKAKVINDIQVWTDAFLIYALIYTSAHPESRAQLFKYIHTIRSGANRVKTLGWRDYDIQFRLKKEANPSLSFAVVDQELWLLYMYNPPSTQTSSHQAPLQKCYEFNYKGICNKLVCQYKHECMICSQNHPYIKHKTSSGSSLNFRSTGLQATWRPQLPRRPAAPSSAIKAPYTQSARPQ